MYPKYLKVHSYAAIEELSNQNTNSNTEKFKNSLRMSLLE